MDRNIVNSAIERIYALTPLQEGMLYHYLVDKGSKSYVTQDVYLIDGIVDEQYIKKALHFLTQKYSVLRTSIMHEKISMPRQVVLKERDIEYEKIDLSESDEEKQSEKVNKILYDDINRGFDIQRDSLLRITYITLKNKSYMVWTSHHIILDGWSTSLVVGDFKRYYAKLKKGNRAAQIEKEIEEEKNKTPEFGAYVNWAKSQDKESAIEYWKQFTGDYESKAEVRPMLKPKKIEKQVDSIELEIPEELSQRIIKLAKKSNVTINNIVETAWGILLQKHNNTDDVIFGKVVSGREAPLNGIEKMVGLCINTVPVRVKTDKGMTIEELIRALKDQGIDGKNHEYCSLAEIQSATKQKSELIKTLFVFENYYVDEDNLILSADSLKLTLVKTREQTNYALTFGARMIGAKLNFDIMYNPNEYERNEIENILAHIEVVLGLICHNPQKKVNEIEVMTEAEKLKVFGEFNNTDFEYPMKKTVIDLFEEQVEKTPNNIAVEYEGEEISYSVLNRKANQLARKLRKIGVKPDDFVVLLTDKSIEMVIGLLGILKAGGAFVPIDPDYPEERIRTILDDCKPKGIITYNAKINTEIPLINLVDEGIYTGISSNLSKVITQENLFYCIYTSGTTGKPKGVMLEHIAIYNLILCGFQYIGMLPFSRVAWTTNLCFDASAHEIFCTLLSGGTGLIIDNRIKKEIDSCVKRLKDFNTDTIFTTPSYFNTLVSEDENYFANGINQIVLAGEEFKVNSAIKFSENVRFYNFYGPAETHCATFKKVEIDELQNNNISIGKPFSNFQIYIQNEGQLQGIGIPGEICIAGIGVARGYFNNHELTTKKFVKNPYGIGMMYRTGDLGRWLSDGNIEYLGRIDEQVKIRGIRIELGEIESTLRKIENVKDCAVIAREDKNGEKAIYAFIVSEQRISVSEFRDTLGKSLPSYMIPSYVGQIEKIPVTTNGKLDKRALPELEASTGKEYEAPRNETEKMLCDIYQEILNIDKVGINDGFFELGGHSLRAIRVINRIEAKTGNRLGIKEIFITPTVKGLSERIAKQEKQRYEPIPEAETKEYYPMSSTQKRTYFICQMDDTGLAYNIPWVMKLTGEVCPEVIREAMQEVLNRHEILRTEFLMKDGEPVQKVRKDASVDYKFIEDTETSEEDIIKDFIKPFDLGKAPLFRTELVKREDHYLLMFDTHHIVSDGMSIVTFLNEFRTLYNGETFKALPRQYKDYSEWMNARDLFDQKKYWLDEFSGEIPVLDLPTDYARKQKLSFRGTTTEIEIGKELGEKIKKLSEKTGTTEYMIFLSVAMILMSKYSSQEDIVIGSPVSARTHKDTEGMLGMFVNTLAMRGIPEGDKIYETFLEEIKEKCIRAYENQEYPFEELIESVNVTRDLSRNPLFDVMLVLQNNEKTSMELNKVVVEHINTKDEISKFNLEFNICEVNNKFEIILSYCTDLYKKETVELMLSHYIVILEQIVENRSKQIKEIEVITEEERGKILGEFNDTRVEYPMDKTVIDLFEEQVMETPENIAVIYEEKKITYAELNKRSNQLARKLRKLGVKPNEFVAIISERSIEMVIGIYGIMKAGGAYVPIDPEFPEERIQYMLEDCRSKAVLVYNAEINTELPVIDLSDKDIYIGESTNLQKVNKSEDLVYCTYTSGTTGNPKGIPVRYRNVVNLITWYKDRFEMNERSKVMLMASLSFDLTQRNIFGPHISGGTVCSCGDTNVYDPIKIVEFVKEQGITIINCAASAFYALINAEKQNGYNGLKSLEKVYLVGEALLYAKLEDYMSSSNCKAIIVNGYGLTEDSGIASTYEVTNQAVNEYIIPIGKPLYNKQMYIVENGKLCGIGVKGEICICGAGVTDGYLNNVELTAEKFVPNPYGEGMMYRTGDLGRWLPDGNIEYLGRMDEQVKIRGLRIELAEIESTLRKIENVKDCAVIAREDKNEEKAIYAYIVSEQEISVSEVRDTLGKSLPSYMIPSYVGQIKKIPVTRNGKLDKRKLPVLEAGIGKGYEAPRSETEKMLCEIYQEVLNVDRVGISDGFFELGGHSLRAIRVINRIEEETGIRLGIKEIFITPTVKGLSEKIAKQGIQKYEPIPEAEIKEYYPMSSTQKRTYFICQMD
ncbi:hypothetical protein BVG16_07760, partial [Paenibacillus selenitireducens]